MRPDEALWRGCGERLCGHRALLLRRGDRVAHSAPGWSILARLQQEAEVILAALNHPHGLIIGAPWNLQSHSNAGFIWDAQALAAPGAAIPAEKLPAIAAAVVAACDKNDGLADGIIADPRRCTFDPRALTCDGADGNSCLTLRVHSLVGGCSIQPLVARWRQWASVPMPRRHPTNSPRIVVVELVVSGRPQSGCHYRYGIDRLAVCPSAAATVSVIVPRFIPSCLTSISTIGPLVTWCTCVPFATRSQV
jgi:tannase/feruloyl esterase